MNVYTYQEVTLNNANEKTIVFAKQLGDSLLRTEGIIVLKLTADEEHFDCQEDQIPENSLLSSLCKKLDQYKRITLSLRTINEQYFQDRINASPLKMLSAEPGLRAFVRYRSTDYYNDDESVDLCVFDEDGLRFPHEEYCDSPELVSDITMWYCNTPDLYVSAGAQGKNKDLHTRIAGLLKQFLSDCCVGEDVDERLTDDWDDCGELMVEGNIWFKNESIPMMQMLLNKILEELRPYEDTELRVNIQAIPDGEGDYDFAAVRIIYKEESLSIGYCRF